MTRNITAKRTVNFKKKAKELYISARSFKREVSAIITEVSEILADKAAREGLFGEDRNCGYCGTDVDYIPEGALELKYINYNCLTRESYDTKNSGVLKCFNGF